MVTIKNTEDDRNVIDRDNVQIVNMVMGNGLTDNYVDVILTNNYNDNKVVNGVVRLINSNNFCIDVTVIDN